MKGITVLTNTGCAKRQNQLGKDAKGIINFSGIQKMCITKKRDDNIGILQRPLRVLIIDPASVPKQTAETYIAAINKMLSASQKPSYVIVGNDYRIPEAQNITCWKTIRQLVA